MINKNFISIPETNELTFDEAFIINLRFGFISKKEMSYRAISQLLHLEINEIKKIESNGLLKLKKSKKLSKFHHFLD